LDTEGKTGIARWKGKSKQIKFYGRKGIKKIEKVK